MCWGLIQSYYCDESTLLIHDITMNVARIQIKCTIPIRTGFNHEIRIAEKHAKVKGDFSHGLPVHNDNFL